MHPKLAKYNILKYPATIAYVLTIVATNTLFLWMPVVNLFGFTITTADFTAGSIFMMRDLSQREIRHYVILAMLIGAGITYLLVNQTLAIASVSAFLVAESIDWSIYSLTKKPLSQRLIWSSLLSCPADSFVFSYLGGYTLADALIMTGAKFIGVLILWYIWRYRRTRQTAKCLI